MVIRIYSQRQRIVFNSVKCFGLYDIFRHECTRFKKQIIAFKICWNLSVWSNTSQSNYRHLQILQSKCLRVIGDYPRRTPVPYLHSTFSLEFIHTFIYPADREFFSEVYCTPQPSYFSNRQLLFTRSPRTVQKIHTQTN
jgi:hypothetical protein